MLLETERLYLREMTAADRPALCRILQDAEVMYAYEHAFDSAEVDAWLEKQFFRYREHGFGLWAVLLKESGDMIGQCGITMQDFNGVQVPEIGYLFAKAYWHRGYATEAALGCRKYAFEVLGLSEVYAIIRDSNLPSQNVARRCGMSVAGHLVKHYYGMDMPHTVFSVKREDGSALTRP
ncbi:MAG: GNAT family N-acetyltransferase [Eubacteriales bacterium]